MSYAYIAFVQYRNSSGRLANLTNTAAITALQPDGTPIAGAAFTNLATGLYRAQVTHADLEPVLFRIVPHLDDQDDFEDVIVMHEQVIHILDALSVSVDALVSWSPIALVVSITPGEIVEIRGNSWVIVMDDLTLSDHKQQFAIKYDHYTAAVDQRKSLRQSAIPDADSLLFVDSDTGLLYVNAAAASDPTLATLTYAGTTLTLTLDPSITAQLAPGSYIFGIQSVDPAGLVLEAYGGKFIISADVVRSVE